MLFVDRVNVDLSLADLTGVVSGLESRLHDDTVLSEEYGRVEALRDRFMIKLHKMRADACLTVVANLAATMPPVADGSCTLCYSRAGHEKSCPWLMAGDIMRLAAVS